MKLLQPIATLLLAIGFLIGTINGIRLTRLVGELIKQVDCLEYGMIYVGEDFCSHRLGNKN